MDNSNSSFRFSIGSLLVVVTFISVWLCSLLRIEERVAEDYIWTFFVVALLFSNLIQVWKLARSIDLPFDHENSYRLRLNWIVIRALGSVLLIAGLFSPFDDLAFYSEELSLSDAMRGHIWLMVDWSTVPLGIIFSLMPICHLDGERKRVSKFAKFLQIGFTILAAFLAALILFLIICDSAAITFLTYIACLSVEGGKLNIILTEERLSELHTLTQMEQQYDLVFHRGLAGLAGSCIAFFGMILWRARLRSIRIVGILTFLTALVYGYFYAFSNRISSLAEHAPVFDAMDWSIDPANVVLFMAFALVLTMPVAIIYANAGQRSKVEIDIEKLRGFTAPGWICLGIAWLAIKTSADFMPFPLWITKVFSWPSFLGHGYFGSEFFPFFPTLDIVTVTALILVALSGFHLRTKIWLKSKGKDTASLFSFVFAMFPKPSLVTETRFRMAMFCLLVVMGIYLLASFHFKIGNIEVATELVLIIAIGMYCVRKRPDSFELYANSPESGGFLGNWLMTFALIVLFSISTVWIALTMYKVDEFSFIINQIQKLFW